MRIQGYPILLTELRQPGFPMQECAEIISQCNIIEAYIILVINVRSYKPSGHLPLVLIVDNSLVGSVTGCAGHGGSSWHGLSQDLGQCQSVLST